MTRELEHRIAHRHHDLAGEHVFEEGLVLVVVAAQRQTGPGGQIPQELSFQAVPTQATRLQLATYAGPHCVVPPFPTIVTPFTFLTSAPIVSAVVRVEVPREEIGASMSSARRFP